MNRLYIFLLLTANALLSWAQVPVDPSVGANAPIDVSRARITREGSMAFEVRDTLVFNARTRQMDTARVVVRHFWNMNAEQAREHVRAMARKAGGPNRVDSYNEGNSTWLDCLWFAYTYPSVDALGNEIELSSLLTMPDQDGDQVNNVIIGCHITITSNRECPSEYSVTGSWKSDNKMLMFHATSGATIHKPYSDMAYYNVVIQPDYEGYGVTKNRAHPYLYQELTARQVVDGVRYGIALYNRHSKRLPFRSGWKSITDGYSQGGSVSMATMRFIEQNGLATELNLAGAVCGDGPYDPVATVRYYMSDDATSDHAAGHLSMPVVMPLILKGMLDSNPYMQRHAITDYLSTPFLETGIIDMLEAKSKSDPAEQFDTSDITDAFKNLYKNGNSKHPASYFKQVLNSDGTCEMRNIVTTQCYNYLNNAANFNALPTRRGVMEDLHMALATNSMTYGWQPRHKMILIHSDKDTVVPYANAVSVLNAYGTQYVQLVTWSGVTAFDHVNSGTEFFLLESENDAIRTLASE